MGTVVVATAQLMCSFGTTPSALTVVPAGASTNQATGQAIATIMDYKPNVNIATFGMCTAPANPQVIAATSAALGVFTPQPCIPATIAPWTPGNPKVLVGGNPVLTDSSKCICMWAGQITISSAGQMKTSTG